MKINAPLALFLIQFLGIYSLKGQTPSGGWGNCEFATVASMNAFDPSGSTYTCKKAYITATDEHYRWDGSAWILESDDDENIYNTSDALTADRVVTLAGNDLTFTGTNDIFFQADGKVGINTVAPGYDLDVNGIGNIETRLYVGPNAGTSSNTTSRFGTNFTTDANTYQLYSNTTITSPTLSSTRSSYGAYFNLLNNKDEGTGDSDATGGFFQVNNSGTTTYRTMYGVRGYAQNTSTAGSGLGSLYGGYFRGYNASSSGTIGTIYGSFSQARGRTGAAGAITNTYGARGESRPYDAAITNAYGLYGYTATTNSYAGDIANAYGVYGYVRVDSDDGGDITNAYAGYFQTNRRTGANLINRADGVYINTNDAVTAYGARIYVDDADATNNYGIYLDAYQGSGSNYGIYGVRGDWVLDEDGDGTRGGAGSTGGGDLILGESGDLELYHDGTNSQIINNTGDLNITSPAAGDVNLSTNTGNVGIGTTSPDAKLDVENGTVRFSDYGAGTYDTGNETYILAVEADGDIVEVDPSSLGGSSANIYTADGTLGANRTVDMDGKDLTFDATSDVVIKSTGRIGMGTPTPTQMLDIAGSNKVQIGTFGGSGGGKLRVDISDGEVEVQGIKAMVLRTAGTNYAINGTAAGAGATRNTGLYGYASGAASNFGLWVNSGLGIFDDSIGIGTLAPDAPLHVDGGANFNSVIIGESTNTTAWSRTITGLTPNIADGSQSGLFTFGQADSPREAGHMYFVDSATDGEEYVSFAIRSGAWDILTMNGDGDVGIGTNSPDALLDVEGGTVRFSDYGAGTYDTGNETYILAVEADGDIVEVDPSSLGGGSSTNIYNTNGALTANRGVEFGAFDLTFDATIDVVIKSSGRVGIGETDPDGPLHIKEATGTAASASNGSIIIEHDDSGGSSSVVFKSNVNAGSDYGYIQYSDDGSGNGSSTENSLLSIGTQNDGVGAFQDDIALLPSGNLGIGTSSPAAKLDVDNGSVRFSDYGSTTTYLDTASASTPAEVDFIMGVDSEGDVKLVNTIKSSKILYPPAIVVDASATGTSFTLDLHDTYETLYSIPAVASSGAPASIPIYSEDELFYYVTDYDTATFSNVSISIVGVLSYDIISTPADNCSIFNVVFVVK